MNPSAETFTISTESLRDRRRNVLRGALLSLLLAILMVWANRRYPQTYNDVLLWSIVGFVFVANLVNAFRHIRYVRRVQDHRIEVYPGSIAFLTGGDRSELSFQDIAAVRVYRARGTIGHIQIQRTDHRGIRLEGYRDMERMAAVIKGRVPAAHWVDN